MRVPLEWQDSFGERGICIHSGKYDGLNGIPAISLFGITLGSGRAMFYLIWVVVIVAVIALQNLLNSRPGRAIRALKGGGVMAEAMGVNTAWMKIVIFVIALIIFGPRKLPALLGPGRSDRDPGRRGFHHRFYIVDQWRPAYVLMPLTETPTA